jgi:GntR family transcriptional regulator/MocR family aminotransferase
MRKVASSTPLIVEIDQSSDEPLYRQIYRGIREAILSGRLRRGARVPSTRLLAADLGLARSTVVLAFEHLVAEGYLRATTSVGSRVAGAASPRSRQERHRGRAHRCGMEPVIA